MDELTRVFTASHRHCDGQLAQLEHALAAADWDAADRLFHVFQDELQGHLATEEEILFPAFEQVTGQALGPTQVMRDEHEQMRELLQEMAQALTTRDATALPGVVETLLILIQQHNIKEEQVLYPMLDDMVPEAVRQDALVKLGHVG